MNSLRYFLCAVAVLIVCGCMQTRLSRTTYHPGHSELTQRQTAEFKTIKVHQKDGSLYILNAWETDDNTQIINGTGYRLTPNRKPDQAYTGSGNSYQIPYDDIALIETNKLQGDLGSLLLISVAVVPTAIAGVICLADPKACFGSCPTFYAQRNGQWKMLAEGFSSSISSAFEKTDVDMLWNIDQDESEVSLRLTNEALETHVIRYVNLLAFPKEPGETVFATEEGRFYRCTGLVPPTSCQAPEGDIRPLIGEPDQKERFSLADEHNLAEREELFLQFEKSGNEPSALIISSRQTLLTTFLFYQLIAYSGNSYGQMVSRVENGDKALTKRIARMWDKLGGIEIFLKNDKQEWQKIDEINEMGPIAADIHLVKIPSTGQDKISLKIRQTKGLWRIDYLALAKLIGEESPLQIKPEQVIQNDTVSARALSLLLDDHKPLITLPGDKYELNYRLPGDCTYQLFLETKGYYLEWMRENWLSEENRFKAAMALQFPGIYFRKAAPAFKLAEPYMEETFWNSRYVKE